MFHQNLKKLFNQAVSHVSANISDYVMNPKKDFSRTRKIPADLLMSFLVDGENSAGVQL